MSRFSDDDLAFITIDKGICNKCIHVRDDGLRCRAFPEGIPEEVLTGRHDHHFPHPDDMGIHFERRE